MRKFITPKSLKKETVKKKVVVPSDETIHFLKAFARAYHAEPSLPASLSGVCIN